MPSQETVIADPLAADTSSAAEIGYKKELHSNCSQMLWQNLDRNPGKQAVMGPMGTMTYRELITEAARWGNAFVSAGLKRGERIAFFWMIPLYILRLFMVRFAQGLCLSC